MTAPRVLISIVPPMYAEALAFSLGKHRPRAEVSVLGPSDDLGEEAGREMPHLIVANRVPPVARGAYFWVEVEEPSGGAGAKSLGAGISADGRSGSVADLRTGHVLAALDRAEDEHLLGGGRGRGGEAAS